MGTNNSTASMSHLKLVRLSGAGSGESHSRDPHGGAEAGGASRRDSGLQRRSTDELARVADAVRAGDHVATRTLITTVGPKMLQVVRRILGANHADVEDVTQEASYALIGALSAFRGECTLTHFACRVAAQLAIEATLGGKRPRRGTARLVGTWTSRFLEGMARRIASCSATGWLKPLAICWPPCRKLKRRHLRYTSLVTRFPKLQA